MQGATLVHRDVRCRVASDLVLTIFRRAMAPVSFVRPIAHVNPDDASAHQAGFRIPAHPVSYLECAAHWSAPSAICRRVGFFDESRADFRRASNAFARAHTASTVNPYSRRTTSPGADAPKRSTPRTSPASPT